MILSFSITSKLAIQHKVADPLRTGAKTVSRRLWTDQQAQRWVNAWNRGEARHQAWSALPFVLGAHLLGYIQLCECPYSEMLRDMPESDVPREGGFWIDRQHYINDVGAGKPDLMVWVVRWNSFSLN